MRAGTGRKECELEYWSNPRDDNGLLRTITKRQLLCGAPVTDKRDREDITQVGKKCREAATSRMLRVSAHEGPPHTNRDSQPLTEHLEVAPDKDDQDDYRQDVTAVKIELAGELHSPALITFIGKQLPARTAEKDQDQCAQR